ncbi:hypothetical protein GCM10027286_05220 [Virgibacillus ainsalahensis]
MDSPKKDEKTIIYQKQKKIRYIGSGPFLNVSPISHLGVLSIQKKLLGLSDTGDASYFRRSSR